MNIARLVVASAIAALAAFASLPAAAQDAGVVQFASGTVEILRGAQRIAAPKGTAVLQGDTVATAADGTAQLLMVDGALVSMRPSTQMAVERYAFDAASATSGEALLALVRGTMRTFTGLIVARDREKFRMRTSLATLGIRGSGNILAHGDGIGTVNHTLTGAHSVTSPDAEGVERTLVSYPGQTVQVLPGQAPRFIPTPPFILAGASKATQSASTEEKAAGETTTTSGTGAEEATTVGETGGGNAAVASAQATTSTVGSAIAAVQPPPDAPFEALFRSANPLASGGYEGVIGQTSGLGEGGVVLDASSRLVLIRNGAYSEFLSGGGGPFPPGYAQFEIRGADISFTGGQHFDGYRTPDGAVVIGRWEGGSIVATGGDAPNGSFTLPLGPRSVTYDVTIPLHPGVFGSFTGAATYTLVAATSPADALGNVGSVSSARLDANFSNRTIAGSFALSVNGQNFTISGTDTLNRRLTGFDFATALRNITIGCSGANCASQGYQSTMNGRFAGADGRWATVTYRVNPARLPDNGFADLIVGSMVLGSGTPPTVGIQLPQTGTASLVFTGPAFLAPGEFAPPLDPSLAADRITGTLQANFSTQTVGFNATIGNSGSGTPTYVASTSNAPIVGVGFSASTSPGPNQGTLAVTCTGSPCGATGSGSGRFDGFFTSSSGQQGQANFSVGDSLGIYNGGANFGVAPVSVARAVAADVQRGRIAIDASPAAVAAPLALAPARIGRRQAQ